MLEKIKQDLKQAQLMKDEIKVSTLRLLLSEIHNSQIQKGEELSEVEIVSVIQREAKKRKEAAIGFRQGGREDTAQKEEVELKILEGYLPEQLTEEELTNIIKQVITDTGAASLQDMGKVIGAVMGKVAGRADGGRVAVMVKERLSK